MNTDILLVTVTKVETQAVITLFAEATGQPFQRFVSGDKTYFDLGMLSGARIMMVQSEMGATGPCGSLLVVDEGIRTLSPSAVIMVGIAFGIDDKKRQRGDILVSQQLLGYEPVKITTDEQGQVRIILRGDRPKASIKLLDRCSSAVLDWQGARVEFGLLLSGEKLIDNWDFRQQLRKLAPEAIGGEMEGTGLYSAAQRRKVDWLIIKAISDWADGTKKEHESQYQQVAAENAVRFTIHVLKQGGFVEQPARDSASPTTRYDGQRGRSREVGTLVYKHDEHASWVVAVAWEPDGTRIASAGGDGTVRIWESETGEALLTYRGHTRLLNAINFQSTIYTVAWACDGLRIASAGDGTTIRVWNPTSGQTFALYQAHSGSLPKVFALAWSPDGKQIVSACSSIGMDKTLHHWDSLTGQKLGYYDARYGLLPNFSVLSVAWSPDGAFIAAACGDKTIRVWDAATAQLAATYHFKAQWSSHIAWSPDSRYLASAQSDHTAQVWDTVTRKSIVIYRGHTDSVRYVAWSPDGTSIATASNDKTVQIWEALTGTRLYTYRSHDHWTTSLAWSPDGARIASASNDKTVQVWQARDTG